MKCQTWTLPTTFHKCRGWKAQNIFANTMLNGSNKFKKLRLGQCRSVMSVDLWTKRSWLNLWSGHMLRLWAPSPIGGYAGGSWSVILCHCWCFYLSVPLWSQFKKKRFSSMKQLNISKYLHMTQFAVDINPCSFQMS